MTDLATGVQSRVVTITAVEFAEDAPKAGTITFTLLCDLRHAESGVIIAAGSRTVQLIDGEASLRLFTDSPGLTDGARDRWALLVKPSWMPHPYPIRVPVGTSPISLAAIPVFDWRTR